MKQQRLLSFLTLFIVLYIQYGAVVHAADHQFHQYEASCDLYSAAERLSDTTVQASLPAITSIPDASFNTVAVQHLCEPAKPLPQSRSPPSCFL